MRPDEIACCGFHLFKIQGRVVMISIEALKGVGGPLKMEMVMVFLGNRAIACMKVWRDFFNIKNADIDR